MNISWEICSSITPLQISVYFPIASTSESISFPLSSLDSLPSHFLSLPPFLPPPPLSLSLYLSLSRTQAFKLLHSLYLQSKLFAMLHTFWLPPGTCIQVQTKARQTHIASVPWNSPTSRWLKALPGAPEIQVGPQPCFKSSPPVIPLSSRLPAAESWVCGADCWVPSGVCLCPVQEWETGWCSICLQPQLHQGHG